MAIPETGHCDRCGERCDYCTPANAAGKADALPQWPPENLSQWYYAEMGSEFDWCDGRGEWEHSGGHSFKSQSLQIVLTAAYFRGELEEVK